MTIAATPLRACTAVVAAVLLLPGASTVPQARPGSLDDATIVHVLERTGFGSRIEEVARIRQIGIDRYLDEQLQPERLSDDGIRARLAAFETLALDSSAIAARYYAPLIRDRRARRGEPSAPAMDPAAPASAEPVAPADRAALRDRPEQRDRPERRERRERRQTGRLVLNELAQQKILRAVHSPRQLEEVLVDFWFNHFNVFAGKGPVRVYLTEYEREAIRPHVLGRFRALLGAVATSPAMLFYLDNWQSTAALDGEPTDRRQRRGLNENYARELMELHTLGAGGGYTQADVVEVAKAFTGWTIRRPREGGGYAFEARRHAKGPRTVLGTTIAVGGRGDGEQVLDLLAAHPSTAAFIATKLSRRFVADQPPPALVKRVAASFTRSGGDLRAVVRTILTSPEFLSAEARRAKVKTPFEFVISAIRLSRAEIVDASSLVRQLRLLGMPLYFAQPPTGYADTADAWANTGALLNRMNFAVDLTANRLPGIRVDLAALAGTTDTRAAQAWAISHLLHGRASASTSATLGRATDLASVAALSLGSPEFQRR
jgi:uncharacterized protein (DUF1800 family)